MKTTNLFVFIILAALSFSCEKNENKNPLDFQLGEAFDLAFGDTGNCTCDNLSVSFADVLEDSRCPFPAEFTCFWEGRAWLQMNVQLPDEQNTVELIMQGSGDDQARDTLSGFVFELLEVSPYPTSANPIPKRDYRIEMKVYTL